jgi:hypothetical protein
MEWRQGIFESGWPDEFVKKSPKMWPNTILVKINEPP